VRPLNGIAGVASPPLIERVLIARRERCSNEVRWTNRTCWPDLNAICRRNDERPWTRLAVNRLALVAAIYHYDAYENAITLTERRRRNGRRG
jgi:hypothetical protein